MDVTNGSGVHSFVCIKYLLQVKGGYFYCEHNI